MRIQELIDVLEKSQEKLGNVEVFLSSDAEGNSFHGVDDVCFDCDTGDAEKIIIFPSHD